MTISLAQAILTASRSMPADNGYALVPDAALRVLIDHAAAGQALRDIYDIPAAPQGPVTRQDPPDPALSGPATFVKRQALRDQFAMHAPMAPLPDGMGGNAAEREILRNRARVALAYADEMMRQTGRP